MKFLIIRFSSIGDIVLTTPLLRCLKKQAPTAVIHYLTKKTFAPVLKANPYIDQLHLLEDDAETIIKELQQADVDYVIDLHHNLRSLKVKRALGKQSFSFYKLNIEKWLLTAFKINRLPQQHIVDRYLATMASFGLKNDGAGLDYFIPDGEGVKESDIPASHHAGYIILVIGGTHFTKRYPVKKLEQLCKELDHPIIIAGGKEEQQAGEELAALDPFKIYNACGKFSLNESADLVRRAKLVVSNDTGLMHIAAAFKKPIISLWGNTVPAFGMTPYYGQHNVANKIMEVTGLSCRPCSKIGYDKCPKGHFNCMQQIDPTVLHEEILKLLGRK